MDTIPQTYREALDFLFRSLPMFSRVGAAAMKKDLTNIRLLCDALGNPQNRFKSIHIAGTNGKGSVSHMLAAILQSSGYKTGLYTSPHLKDFRERIRIDGEMVSQDFVTGFIRDNFELMRKIQPSFFEVTVAMAFTWFEQRGVDVAVVETGLGGRLDSTNILLPEISIITNISLDHQYLLGDTPAAIAGEKAGIIKYGVPVVIGERSPETQPVFIRKAAALHAPMYFAEEEREIVKTAYTPAELTITLRDAGPGEAAEHTYHLDLGGSYQEKNIGTVLSAVGVLNRQGWAIADSPLRAGLSAVRKLTGLRGRWEVLGSDPLIVADVGHNEAGIREIVRRLAMLSYDRLHVVAGFVKDKDISAILPLLPPGAEYYFCRADLPRALPAEELAARARAAGLRGNAYPDVLSAFGKAREHAGRNDVVIVCGSVFVVAEVL